MAIDNTPPRVKLIATIAVITVITLVAVNFALTSYFATMTDVAAREKLAPTTERNEQEKAEHAALTSAAIPIDRAMAELAKGTRPEAIAPRPSDDLGPMTGWSRRPKPAPKADLIVPAPAETEGAPEGDAGAAPEATDAGATPAEPTTADAGDQPGHPAAAADGGAGQGHP